MPIDYWWQDGDGLERTGEVGVLSFVGREKVVVGGVEMAETRVGQLFWQTVRVGESVLFAARRKGDKPQRGVRLNMTSGGSLTVWSRG